MCVDTYCDLMCCGDFYTLFTASVSMCLCCIGLNSLKIIASIVHVIINKDLEKWTYTYIIVFIGDNATSVLFILFSILVIVEAWLMRNRLLRCTVVVFVLLTFSRLFCSTTMFAMGEVKTDDGVAPWCRTIGDLSSVVVFYFSAGVFWCYADEIYFSRFDTSSSDGSEEIIV